MGTIHVLRVKRTDLLPSLDKGVEGRRRERERSGVGCVVGLPRKALYPG